MTEHPPFELESYEDTSLPEGKRLINEEDLQGHTIKAVITAPDGRLGDQAELVFVTETLCWLVLEVEDSFSCEERSSITVRGRCYGYSTTETLHDYLSAEQMRRYGLVNGGQFQALKAREDEESLKERVAKAAKLRAQLAKLEDGAA